MKQRNSGICSFSVLATALLLSGCNDSNNSPPAAVAYPPVSAVPPVPLPPEQGPTFANVGVHDPSVIKVADTFYVFGSHLAAAKSTDLMHWQQVADGVNSTNPLFANVLTELEETFAWAQTDTLWATDVIQLADGKFYMYYNACKGDSPRSALGVAVADNIEGPYVNKQILLKSGMWGEISEDGTIYDAQIHPNVVDPQAFFDKNGKLWLVYGSYSGGLFILEMDPATGLTLPGQGYGKHLMGGNHSRIEGAYVLYSPDSDYYYLFSSFGGLDANGAYNMRVARASAPNGPYLDALGNDMAAVKSDPALPLFDDASIFCCFIPAFRGWVNSIS
ncbi:beta-xylosidase [Rheinheimera pacifica]|uniref:family 43 glycosylhydrolase n=1 Tax=Rheinheimera pacifica TaxID=173990 RepID=UPI0028651A15|nr:family 43 glycosylhydrolase [Rheinheimera pacifica]MDR6981669.1 beta-xylosidase [Rheinheimera pacifica]